MAQEDDRWRDKYRSALNQQEQLEKTLSAQQLLLHRTVTVLSDAAEGHDKELDKRLLAIKASLKSNDVAGFDRMLKSLPRVIEETDKYQQQQWQGSSKTLASLADQCQQLAPSLKPSVKHYKKQLPKGALKGTQLPTTVARLLKELYQLQQQALNINPPPKTSLIDKLFKSKENSVEKSDVENNGVEKSSVEKSSVEKRSVAKSGVEKVADTSVDINANLATEPTVQAIPEQAGEQAGESEAVQQALQPLRSETSSEDQAADVKFVDHTPVYRERSLPEAMLQRPINEPASPQISDRVTMILIELLDHFPNVECAEQKALNARKKIERGLNWHELAPILEDIRDFVIQSQIGADDNYRHYLGNVYAELNGITQALGIAMESEQQHRLTANQLHGDVSEGMLSIQQALTTDQEVGQLKQAVESQVKSIQDALSQFTQAQKIEDDSLSSQLSVLIERVKKMEEQDTDIREQLEQEKIRATTDNLTGLPNREAYGKRVHDEMVRWHRYQHPLSLAILDIDFFKKINDNYGHQTGDKVLKIVSSSVSKQLREVDFMARFGGEEFIILLPETSAENALLLLDRLREKLANSPFRYKEEKISITASLGIAEFKEGDTVESVFERADKALYNAKESGRNKCCLG